MNTKLMNYLITSIMAFILLGCGESQSPANSLQTDLIEVASKKEKTELTIESVVGKFKMAFSSHVFDKNGTCKAMRGDNVMGSGTWTIKDGKIHVVNDDETKNLVIYEMLENGDLKHPSGNVAKRIITQSN